MYTQRVGAMMLALSAAAAMSGCSQDAQPVMAEETNQILAETIAPQVGDLELTTAFIGTVEPDEFVSVYPKVSGTVLNTYFQVGDTVKKGDLLFEIDPTDIQLSVDIAQAQLMAAQAQMDQALGSTWDLQMAQLESQVKQAQQSYSQARQSLRDYNDGNEDDMDELWDQLEDVKASREQTEQALESAQQELADIQASQGAGSDDWMKAQRKIANLNSQLTQLESTQSMLQANYNELDDDESSTHSSLRNAVRNAQIAYDSATQIYELTKDEAHNDAIKVAQANLGSATASFNAQAQQLEYTKVYAPIDGVVEQCNVTEQGNASPSSAAYTVSNKSTITVIFYVPSSAVESMAPGDPVTVENGQVSYEGSITEVGSMVDAQTGLFRVKAVVNCEDGSLLTGLSVKVEASTSKAQQAMLLPQEVVYYENGQPYVYTVEGNTAVQTYIQVGISNEETVEVISGLTPDSQVISSWDPNLTDGAEVSVVTTDSTESGSESASSQNTSSESTSEANPSEPSAQDASPESIPENEITSEAEGTSSEAPASSQEG